MSKKIFNIIFILLLTFFTIFSAYFVLNLIGFHHTFSILISIFIGATLSIVYFNKNYKSENKRTNQHLKNVSKERIKFYHSHGLTDDDIIFFRKTMNTAKIQILEIEKNANQTGKLKAIFNRNNTLNLIKVLFKDIVNEPERLHEVDQFLYVHLTSLFDLTTKYVQVNKQEVKNKETFYQLEKSAGIIDQVCKQITNDYLKFRSSDYNDLTNEMELAAKRLEKQNNNIKNDEI